MSRCRSCDAEIRWATTPAGKAIPLDLEPSPFGNVLLSAATHHEYGNAVAKVLAGAELEQAHADGRRLFMPHHATCPHGKAWKKKR